MAVMVSVNVPVGALRPVLTVSLDEPEVLIDDGLKLALLRFGSPDTFRLTVLVKPAPAATVTV